VVRPQIELPVIELTSTPNVTLIVLDGYGRSDVIDEFYGYDNQKFERRLEEYGFDVANLATSNYSITHLSIPALLNMSLMHPKNAVLGPADLTALAESISGKNAVVQTFKDAGYSYVHGGFDSWLNHCGTQVDLCLSAGLIASPPLDWSTVGPLLERTPIGSFLFPGAGGALITAMNLRRIDEFNNWNQLSATFPKSPTFTFVHLLLPHPPLGLDSGCDVQVDEDLRESVLYRSGYDEETMRKRRSAWIEQVQCVNMAVLAFVRQADPNDAIVITADHGPDSVFNVFDAHSLSPKQIRERFSVLTAVRLPDQCDPVPADVMQINIFRHIFDCLSDDDVPPIEAGHYVASFRGYIVEVQHPYQG
jgi:hypothetical protein